MRQHADADLASNVPKTACDYKVWGNLDSVFTALEPAWSRGHSSLYSTAYLAGPLQWLLSLLFGAL